MMLRVCRRPLVIGQDWLAASGPYACALLSALSSCGAPWRRTNATAGDMRLTVEGRVFGMTPNEDEGGGQRSENMASDST